MNRRRLGFVSASDPYAQAAAITPANAPADDPFAQAAARSNEAIFDAAALQKAPLIQGIPDATLFYGLAALVVVLLLKDASRRK